ncbi:MAG: GNAT family N-acetyltransferase [Pseudomonadota bacterium]
MTPPSAQHLNALHMRAFGQAGAHGWREADFARALADDAYTCLTQGAGYAVARRVLDEADLMVIGVAPDARRKGQGTALLTALENTLAARGVAKLMLEVGGANAAALAFYQARGFRQTGRRDGYYGIGARGTGGLGHAALLFEKALI